MNWYRRLDDGNPDAQIAEIATAFVERVASNLDIAPPVIRWFEAVDSADAQSHRVEWLDRQEDPEDDPRQFDCPYFRLGKSQSEGIVGGFTHVRHAGFVWIQVGLSYSCTLHAVADECYHVRQDVVEGTGWRAENSEVAEMQAASFADSLTADIRHFLRLHGVIEVAD